MNTDGNPPTTKLFPVITISGELPICDATGDILVIIAFGISVVYKLIDMTTFADFLSELKTPENHLLLESIYSGYTTLFESSVNYINDRITSANTLLDNIRSSALKDHYIGTHNNGYVFDYNDCYLVLFNEIPRAIGEYTKYKGKAAIICYILDDYLQQWFNQVDNDITVLDKISNMIKQKLKQNITMLVHEWTHKVDDDNALLLDENRRTRKPSIGRIEDVVNKISASHPELSHDYIVKFITAVNSDVEFNAMITAAISHALNKHKTGSFDEFLNSVLTSDQFIKNKQLLTDKLYRKLLKRVHQYYDHLTQ